jgi:hypothetical protein
MMVEVSVFELPRLLGIPQYVEFEPPPKEWCTPQGCPHEGWLMSEGCRRGVCVRYKVWLTSWDGQKWSAKERWRRRRQEEGGGCVSQLLTDALWELAERGFSIEVDNECGIVINGVRIGTVSCRSVDKCVEEIIKAYEYAKAAPPKPRRDPAEEEYEELLKRYGWLGWWNRAVVIDALRRNPHYLRELLQRLDKAPHFVRAFLGRFDLDLRCVVDVFGASDGSYCVSFCARDFDPKTWCYEPGRGWRPAPRPKFTRHRPTEDGRLLEVYTIENREYVRVA